MSTPPAQSNARNRYVLLGIAAFGLLAGWPSASPSAARAIPSAQMEPEPGEDELWYLLLELLRFAYEHLNQTDAPASPPTTASGWIDLIAGAYAVNGPPVGLTEEERLATLQTLENTSEMVKFFQDQIDPVRVLVIQGVIFDAYGALGGNTADLDN
ncbi:MAG: hypothetical protein IT437_04980 [Phycisphaerales bacterium]|nr:hypothetical protein [Phycisphaerales bacterium]